MKLQEHPVTLGTFVTVRSLANDVEHLNGLRLEVIGLGHSYKGTPRVIVKHEDKWYDLSVSELEDFT